MKATQNDGLKARVTKFRLERLKNVQAINVVCHWRMNNQIYGPFSSLEATWIQSISYVPINVNNDLTPGINLLFPKWIRAGVNTTESN